MTGDQTPKATRREWIGLFVLALPTMLLSLDVSVLFLALPHLSADLGADSNQQLWITDVYGFMIAGFLVTMGTLGDRIGRRKLLLIGAAAFGVASTLAAFATSAEMLILFRGLLGIAGSTLLPSTLALISNMFHNPRQRSAAIAVWGTSFMAGITLGPVVGGALLASFWWGSVFLLAVPVMGVLLLAAPTLLPEYRDPNAGRVDLPSVVLSLATVFPIIYGFKELAKGGWDVLAAAAVVVGLAVGAVFVFRQRTLSSPLLDVRLFTNRTFSAAAAIGLFIAALQSGIGLFAALYLQTVAGLSPLQAGLWLAPPALALIISINLVPALASRFRPAYVLAGGMAVSVVGHLLLTQLDGGGGSALLVIGVSIVYIGVGPSAALINHLVLGSAPPERAGSASAISSTSGEFGVGLGIAVFGSVGAVIYRSQMVVPVGTPDAAAGIAGESIAGAVSEAQQLPAALTADLLATAREAFTSGLNTVAGLSAVLFVCLAVLTVTALRHVRPTGEPEPDKAEQPDSAPEASG